MLVITLSVLAGDGREQITLCLSAESLGRGLLDAVALALAERAYSKPTPPPPDEQGGEWAKSGNTHAIYRTDSGAVGGVP